MAEVFTLAPEIVLALLVGYALGALPVAELISRRNGVDIFSVGTGLPGSSNVYHHVGPLPAGIVLIGDLGKGAFAVLAAGYIGVEGPWLLLPAFAAIVGHWRSVFSRFKGGDGLAVLGGSTIALFPVFGTAAAAVAILVALGGQRMPYTSLMGIVSGYITLVALTLTYSEDTVSVVGFGGLFGLVLAHALLGHRRRRHAVEWDELEEANGATRQSRAR